jgi:ABC-type phosphate transport system permease subunit
MANLEYLKKFVGALFGAMIGIPSIAIGFYVTYQLVASIGN